MYHIKKASIADCTLINSLASQVWEDTYGNILSPEQLAYMFHMMYDVANIEKQMQEEGHTYFLIYNDTVPCAYLSIEQTAETLFVFQKVYALPSMQGKGVGRYMIEQGIAYLKGICSTPFSITLNVNRNNSAKLFYEHLGFHVAAERDHPIGDGYFMNDYIMQIDITI